MFCALAPVAREIARFEVAVHGSICASLGSPLVESMVISSARIILGLVTGDREFFARGVAHGRRQLSWLYWSYSFAALSQRIASIKKNKKAMLNNASRQHAPKVDQP
jgi:hypothetical protein